MLHTFDVIVIAKNFGGSNYHVVVIEPSVIITAVTCIIPDSVDIICNY